MILISYLNTDPCYSAVDSKPINDVKQFYVPVHVHCKSFFPSHCLLSNINHYKAKGPTAQGRTDLGLNTVR